MIINHSTGGECVGQNATVCIFPEEVLSIAIENPDGGREIITIRTSGFMATVKHEGSGTTMLFGPGREMQVLSPAK